MFIYSAIPVMPFNNQSQFQVQPTFNNGLATIVPIVNMKAKRQTFKPHSKFTEEDDSRLRELVGKYGENSWIQIASEMPGRNSRQCRERWLNYLSPNLNTNAWTPEEDSLLLEKQKELGTSWVKISKFFDRRTDQMCKNRFYLLQRKMEKKANMKKNMKIAAPKLITAPFFFQFQNNNNMNLYSQCQNNFQANISQSSSETASPFSSCISSPIQNQRKSESGVEINIDLPVIGETTDICLSEPFVQNDLDNNYNYENICGDFLDNIESLGFCDDLF